MPKTLIALASVVALGACGSSRDSADEHRVSDDAVVGLLNRWVAQIKPVTVDLAQRESLAERASQSMLVGGQPAPLIIAKLSRLEGRIEREAALLYDLGRDACTTFVDLRATPASRAAVDAGHAYELYGIALTIQPDRRFEGVPIWIADAVTSSRIADLGSTALSRLRAAYKLAGAQLKQ